MPEKISSNSSNKQPSTWTQQKMGVFWIKTNQKGKSYLSGTVEMDGKKIPIHIYKNDFQEGKTPHFHAYAIPQKDF